MALAAGGTRKNGLRNLTVGAVTISIDTTSTLNGDTTTITFYEDTDNDGSAENTETFTVSGGSETFGPSNLELAAGNDLWWQLESTDGDSDVTTALSNINVIINY